MVIGPPRVNNKNNSPDYLLLQNSSSVPLQGSTSLTSQQNLLHSNSLQMQGVMSQGSPENNPSPKQQVQQQQQQQQQLYHNSNETFHTPNFGEDYSLSSSQVNRDYQHRPGLHSPSYSPSQASSNSNISPSLSHLITSAHDTLTQTGPIQQQHNGFGPTPKFPPQNFELPDISVSVNTTAFSLGAQQPRSPQPSTLLISQTTTNITPQQQLHQQRLQQRPLTSAHPDQGHHSDIYSGAIPQQLPAHLQFRQHPNTPPVPPAQVRPPHLVSITPHQQQQQQAALLGPAVANGQHQPGSMDPPAVPPARNSPTGSTNTSPGGRESGEESCEDVPLPQLAQKRSAPSPVGALAPAASTPKKPRTPKKRKKKDPNEPQKPVSAYAMFFRDTQAAIKGQNPNASFGEVSKIVASMWDNLNIEEKGVYKKRTEVAKKEYLKQLAAYKASLISQQGEGGTVVSVTSTALKPRQSSPLVSNQQASGMSPAMTTAPPLSHYTPPPGSMAPPHAMQPHPAMMQQQNMYPVQGMQPPGMAMHNMELANQGYGGLCDSGLCVRNGCNNPAISNPGWDNEYCSNECVVSHWTSSVPGWPPLGKIPPAMHRSSDTVPAMFATTGPPHRSGGVAAAMWNSQQPPIMNQQQQYWFRQEAK